MTKIELLKQLDLSSPEIKLYLAALELSPATVSALAKKAEVERTASYPHLEKLVKMGLLSVLPEKGKRLYVAENPKIIGKILDEKKKAFQKALPELMSAFNIIGIKPTIRYYEGRQGMREILNNSISTGAKEVLHFTPSKNALAVLGNEYARRHIEERVKRGIKVKALRPKQFVAGPWEFIAKEKMFLRQVRYLPHDFKLENFIIIYLNTVAIISSIRENYGVEIESKEFTDTMRSLFYLVWYQAKK